MFKQKKKRRSQTCDRGRRFYDSVSFSNGFLRALGKAKIGRSQSRRPYGVFGEAIPSLNDSHVNFNKNYRAFPKVTTPIAFSAKGFHF